MKDLIHDSSVVLSFEYCMLFPCSRIQELITWSCLYTSLCDLVIKLKPDRNLQFHTKAFKFSIPFKFVTKNDIIYCMAKTLIVYFCHDHSLNM